MKKYLMFLPLVFVMGCTVTASNIATAGAVISTITTVAPVVLSALQTLAGVK